MYLDEEIIILNLGNNRVLIRKYYQFTFDYIKYRIVWKRLHSIDWDRFK